MVKQVPYFKQIGAHLEERYGREKKQAVIAKALRRYGELIEENRNEPKAYHAHTRQRIYPSIAVFCALVDEGVERREAEDFVTGYYRWRAGRIAPKIKAILKIPGIYRIVPKLVFSRTKKSFGLQSGFAYADEHLSKDEVRFNMIKCPYYDRCAHYGCPEIVKGFCDADDICYGHMHPRLSWDRTKTIGHGADVCDFKVRIKDRGEKG